jgi:predicted nucleotidyltransferase
VEITELKQKIKPIFEEYHITGASLFGSYARGEQKQGSDIDILVNLPIGQSFGMFRMLQMEYALEDALKLNVDLVTPDGLSPIIYENIKSTLIPLYSDAR